MGYLTAKQFSEIWKISERRIIKLCKENRIDGAIKSGMIWEIPEDTLKPSDKRSSIYKYINIPKTIIILNSKKELKDNLEELLTKEGYIVELESLENIRDNLEKISKYYEGIIYFPINDMDKTEEDFIERFANEKLNSESNIVIVNNKEIKKQTEKLANKLGTVIGLNLNSLIIDAEEQTSIIDYKEISENIIQLLIKLKNVTGQMIVADSRNISFDKNRRTPNLKIGKFYKLINSYFNKLTKDSYLWCASTMLEDEWTEEPQEMKFRLINLEAANRGANIERIFIFSKDKIKQFKNNKTLKIYMQSNIKTLFVDYDEIKEKEPELLKIVNNGWDGIDKETLIVDLPEGSEERGYITQNTKDVLEAYKCFQKLKKYSKDLKEVLK